MRLFFGDIRSRAESIDNDAVNHTQIAHVCVVNTHTAAGFDRGSDHFAVLVHNVTRPVENINARSIGAVLENNESFDRLIICRPTLPQSSF